MTGSPSIGVAQSTPEFKGRREWLDRLIQEWFTRTPGLVEAMFDGLPDVMFYVKGVESRYLWANQTLIDRAGLKVRTNIVGLTADQLFPVAGSSTVAPDLEVIRTGCPIRDLLRLYRTYRGDRFWYLSSKFRLLDAFGHIVGLAVLSRDLPRPNERHRSYNRLARFLAFIDGGLDGPRRIAVAAEHASVSEDTLGRLVVKVFPVTPKQFLMKRRISKACQLLEETAVTITDLDETQRLKPDIAARSGIQWNPQTGQTFQAAAVDLSRRRAVPPSRA